MAKENRVELRMPSELLRRIDDQAAKEGKSRSELMRFMAEIYLRNEAGQRLASNTWARRIWQNPPWVAYDLKFKYEWLLPDPLRYFVVRNKASGDWFVCERSGDLAVPGTHAGTRDDAIRAFYKWAGREIPQDVTIEKPDKKPGEQ